MSNVVLHRKAADGEECNLLGTHESLVDSTTLVDDGRWHNILTRCEKEKRNQNTTRYERGREII